MDYNNDNAIFLLIVPELIRTFAKKKKGVRYGNQNYDKNKV